MDAAVTALSRTTYARRDCGTGFVHLGYGAFHRAHQSLYLDEYMDSTGDLDWGIAAVNLRASDTDQFRLAAGNGEGYVLKAMDPSGETEFRLVRPHVAFADWSVDPDKAGDLLSRKEVRAVTITVTESGYSLNSDWSLDLSDPQIAAETSGAPARTVYGYLAQALGRRAERLDEPVTVLCCDNIRSNGRMLESNFLGWLEASGQDDLADWTRRKTAFPCSMVDRITPRSNISLEAEIAGLFPGMESNPVHSEAFRQWVIEDRFAGRMPDLGRVGVEIVDDVEPYEEAKLRILNGGHCGTAYLAAIAGYETFDEAMADRAIREHYEAWEREEVLPGLTAKLPFDKWVYLDEVTRRFENRSIADQNERLIMDGFSKMPIYIRPTISACLELGITPRRGYDCVASWYVYARRYAAGLAAVNYFDPCWDLLKPLLAEGQEEKLARLERLWGDLPEVYPEFAPGIVSAVREMERKWPV